MPAPPGRQRPGGSSGGATTSEPPAPGLVRVQVSDSPGSAIAGAKVQRPLGRSHADWKGEALVLLGAPDATADLTVSGASFADQSVAATSVAGRVNVVASMLERMSSPAGGSIALRSSVVPTVSSEQQRMSFEIEWVVVDADARPIENLVAADLVLRA